MNLSEAQSLARSLFREFGIDQQGWSFRWDNAKRRHGVTKFATRVISLSRPLTQINDRSIVENTIRHEIAHVLAGSGHGHDATWQRIARQVGANPVRCQSEGEKVSSAWVGICPNCDYQHPRHRAPKAGVRHMCTAPTCRHLPQESRVISWRRAR